MNLYRTIYLFQGLWITFVTTYLPVYLSDVVNYSALDLAILAILGQSPLILKPVVGILADRYTLLRSPRKNYLLFGTGILIGGMGGMALLIAFSQLNLILLFFTLVYLGYAITDVIISAMILDVDRQRNYQIVGNLSFFVAIGSILMMGLYLLIIGSHIDSKDWMVFPVILLVNILLLIVLSLRFKEISEQSSQIAQSRIIETPEFKHSPEDSRFIKVTILLILIFCLLVRANNFTEFIFSQYIVARFGNTNFALLQLVSLISNVVAAFFYILFIRISKWIAPRRIPIIIGCGIFAIITWVFVATGPFDIILLLTALGVPCTNLLNFAFISILIDCTPIKNRNVIYQSYAAMLTLSLILTGSIGVSLAGVLGNAGLFYFVALMLCLNLPIVLNIHPEKFKQIIAKEKEFANANEIVEEPSIQPE